MPFVLGERIWRRAIVLLSALSHFDGHKLTKAHLVFLLPSASIEELCGLMSYTGKVGMDPDVLMEVGFHSATWQLH